MWSNAGTTATITMNPSYKWSDGKPLSSQDVAFDIDLIKAAVKENPTSWAGYQPGFFPDDVASVRVADARTLVLDLKSPVNPSWFYEDDLEALQPLPAHAWARASANGPLLYFTDPANAKQIYDYLITQENATSTWTTNPLWQLVDGPFRLSTLNHSTGSYTMVLNPSYRGPSSHQVTALHAVPFSTEADEFSALQVTALAAAARQVGIEITLVPNRLAAIVTNDDDAASPANENKWAMEDFGSYTQVVYPTTITVFNTGGSYNFGGYSDPQADSLINASVNSANPDAVRAEATYLTAQQPALFQANADVVFAWKKTLSGPPDSFANLTQYYMTPESWYITVAGG